MSTWSRLASFAWKLLPKYRLNVAGHWQYSSKNAINAFAFSTSLQVTLLLIANQLTMFYLFIPCSHLASRHLFPVPIGFLLVKQYIKSTLTTYHFAHFHQYFFFAIDISLLIYTSLNGFQFCMFLSIFLVIDIYHYFSIRIINRVLRLMSKISRRELPIRSFFYNILNHMHFLHWHLNYIHIYNYRDIWNVPVFSFLFLSLPLNVVCILLMTNHSIPPIHVLVIFFIASIHLSIIISLLFLMAWQTESMHKTKKYLPPIIQAIKMEDNWRLKLKYADWFCRLVSGKKCGPYIAIIGHMTYHISFNASAKLCNRLINHWSFAFFHCRS